MTTIRYLNQKDAIVLQRLAEHQSNLGQAEAAVADVLEDILATAVLVKGEVRKKNCVGLNSKVTYSKCGQSESSQMTIVEPQDAHAASSRISILAPLALALIGRKINEIVKVQLPFGEIATLKILDVVHLEKDEMLAIA
jgi:regulator of nucleoside diphosphate kinase